MTRPYQCKSQNILMRKKRRLMGEENNSAENFIICTYHKKTCTENGEEDR